jgi:nucleoid-associated protein YgaU
MNHQRTPRWPDHAAPGHPSPRRGLTTYLVAAATCFLAWGAPGGTDASAAELTHRVKAGESASAIARDYYGDLKAGELVLLYNGATGTMIHVGDSLKIPYTAVHIVKAGDAWSAISKKYLGRPSAYRTIARLNERAPEQPLQIGDRILIPAVLPYTLRRGESLSLLADRFYGDPGQGEVLQEFNEVSDPRRLAPGHGLQIPLVTLVLVKDRPKTAPPPRATAPAAQPVVALKPSPPPVVAQQLPPVVEAPQDPPAPRFTGQLKATGLAFRRGDFARARKELEALQQDIAVQGTDQDRVEFWRQLTFVYVAFDLRDPACTAYGRLLRHDPQASFDPELVSPKIRQAVGACSAG